MDPHYICIRAVDNTARIKREIAGQRRGLDTAGIPYAKKYFFDQSGGLCIGVVLGEVDAYTHRQQTIGSEPWIHTLQRKNTAHH